MLCHMVDNQLFCLGAVHLKGDDLQACLHLPLQFVLLRRETQPGGPRCGICFGNT
jgi:hypothetical protein